MTRPNKPTRYRAPRTKTKRFSLSDMWFWVLQLFILAVIVSASYFIWNWMTNPMSLPFKQVKIISTTHYVDGNQLQQTVKNNITGGFFSLDVDSLKQSVMQLPWIAGVSIRKVWPDELMITVTEQRPLAAWDNEAVFNEQGDLFYPEKKTIPADLPRLTGPLDQPQAVLQQFLFFQAALKPLSLSIASLKVDKRGAWSMTLTNGVKIQIGRKAFKKRFVQFVQLYPRIMAQHKTPLSTVDLRYSNGFAIGWKATK